jgi:hypothetical protein
VSTQVNEARTYNGTQTLAGSPPLALPSGTSGYVLTSDSSGNLTLQPSSGGGGFSNPMTTLGDLLFEDATPAAARLAGNATATKKFLVQTGTGSASAAPSWGAIASGDVPTLNQNTSGTAAGLSSTLAIGSGGTGQATQQAALDALAGAVTSGLVLRGNGTHVTLGAIQAADVPTLNQNTSGTAAGLSSTLAIGSGGTGQATQQAAMDALAGAVTSAQFLRGNGTHVAMGAIQAADMPAGTTSAQGALQLDGTAGHILALGAQAAGANGKPADSGHVHPTTGVALLAGANFTGPLTVAASTQLGSGSAAFAGGAGVVGLANAGTPASGTVSAGLVLFSSAGQLQILNSAGLLLTAQGAQPSPASPVSVSSTSITSLGGLAVPANDPVASAIYRVTLYGFTTNSGTPTCTVDIRWGGTGGTLLCSLQVTLPALTNCFWQAEAIVTFTTTTACNAQLNFLINTAVSGGFAASSHLAGTTSAVTVTTSSNELLTIDATVSSTTGLTFTCLGGIPERVA